MKMKEHKNYDTGCLCEFHADGKLRGGVILEDRGNNYLLGYHGPRYREITRVKTEVKLLNPAKGGESNDT